MKILIVHPQMALYGGAELVIVRLSNYLQKLGHEVSVLTLSTADHSDYRGINFILPDESSRIQYRLRGSLGALRSIARIFTSLRTLCRTHAKDYDVINAHNFPAIWTVPSNRKTVWMCNEVPDLWHSAKVNGLTNKLFNLGRLADGIVVRNKLPLAVVPDERCARTFQNRYRLKPHVIPYGIDGEFFAQAASSYEFQPDDGFRVMCSAMISPSKNQLAVLEAADHLKQTIPNLRIILSGYREPSHPYARLLSEYAETNGLDVTYVEPTDRERLRAIYRMSHVAVFSGRGQGSWLGPFEQLSMGIPIVVSPHLTCSSIIAKCGIGVVTDCISDALREIYRNYPKYRDQARRGKEFVLRELTWEKFGDRMLELMT